MTKLKKNVVDSHDIEALQGLVKDLDNIPSRELSDAVCDIIDIGGDSVSVLLAGLPNMTGETGMVVVQKLEDFFYFHPEKGERIVEKLKMAIKEAPEQYKAGLLSALSDILNSTDESGLKICDMKDEAMAVLCSKSDMARIDKAVEVLVRAEERKSIPHIVNLMINNLDKLDKYENYQFMENALLALKRLGGEAVLRLLINPTSDSAIKQLRVEWRTKEQKLFDDTLAALQRSDSNFAQVMLKVIDLSEFNLPFVAMLNEGIKHSDKWVRQAAVEGLQKTNEAMSPESLSRLLSDPAPEVRLMAVTSLGAFGKEQTGEILLDLATRPDESMEIRLNALYALHSQGNLSVLLQIAALKDNASLTLNAAGLAALLMKHEEGLHKMLEVYKATPESLLLEAAHYLSELSVPEDIGAMVSAHTSATEGQRDKMVRFLKAFLEKNQGPRLEEAMAKQLRQEEANALKAMIPIKRGFEEEHPFENHGSLHGDNRFCDHCH